MISGATACQSTTVAPPAVLPQSLAWATDSPAIQLSGGNRTLYLPSGQSISWHKAKGSAQRSPSSGRYYFEVLVDADFDQMTVAIGVAVAGTATTTSSGGGDNAGDGGRYQYFDTGKKRSDGVYSDYATPYTAGDVIGVSVAESVGSTSIAFYKNGAPLGEAFLVSGTSGSWEPHACFYPNTGASYCQITFQDTVSYMPPDFTQWA